MKLFQIRRLFLVLSITGFLTLSTDAQASAFQLFEQDAASVGNYHAGYAAIAEDASTAYYNPAGITRFKNQQVVIATNAIMPDFKFSGDITVNTIDAGKDILPVTAQGGQFGFVPALHYVAPITDWIGFGFSVDVPFGLRTNYGRETDLRYVATMSAVSVIDVSPVLGIQLTDKASLGLGPDIQFMKGEFDNVGTLSGVLDTQSTNRVDDTGYGFHAGLLYQFTPCARAGISYHSQVVHHLSGTSKFIGPLADPDFTDTTASFTSNRATVNVKLPPSTAISFYDRIIPQVALMGTLVYTQWSSIDSLILNGVAGLDGDGGELSRGIQVVIPQHYHNTWNVSVGANYYLNDKFIFRGGLGYDQTPVPNAYRNVELPDNNRYIVALGAHYQASKVIGLDFAWTHIFINKAKVNPPPQVTGTQITTTNGSVTGLADVMGAQVTWDII